MKAWLVYDRPEAERNRFLIDRYFASCARRGVSLRLVLLEELGFPNAPLPAELPDFCVMRRPVPALSAALERAGVAIFNPSEVARICNDKHATTEYVRALGVPVPEEYYYGAAENAPLVPLPAVCKPVDGHGGQGVFLCKTEGELSAALTELSGRTVVLQRPVSVLGRDLRVYVLGREPVCGMMRISDGDFRSNFCLGGHAERHALTAEEERIVRRVAEGFSFGLVGVDLIYEGAHPVLNEIEDVVGARMLYTYTEIDIADRYVDYILKTMEEKS